MCCSKAAARASGEASSTAPESQGKGYSKEAAAAALASVRERFPELSVVAIIDPTNTASIGLALKLGLRHVPGAGVPHDYEVYRSVD
ncbi:GNAT family N-acetyltransferase [Corynebacterium sp. HMSC29G08]|uniref:GNAT family N-acetyltransferase n=1 Tax=Corynebacterium sp. HMSC29G08 TaxID=1581069 RepID=UPI001FF00988|nr:GNAT family protein [Corynebacterium sp. HMSC29G08]